MLAPIILQAVFSLVICNAGGILPMHLPTLLQVGHPLAALPPWSPGTGAGAPPAGTPLGNLADFPPVALALAVCLVLAIYNVPINLLSILNTSH